MNDKDKEIVVQSDKFLDVMKLDLEVRKSEVEADKEIKLKSLESNDKETDYNFKMFEKEQESNKDRDKFIRRLVYLAVFISVGVIIFGGYLILNNNSLGKDIILSETSLIIGGLAGWGIAQKSKK